MAGARRTTNSNKQENNNGRRPAAKSPTRGGTNSRQNARRPSSSSNRRGRSNSRPFTVNWQRQALLAGLTSIFLAAVLVLSLLSPNQGRVTSYLAQLLWRGFGWGGVLAPVVMVAAGFYLVLWGMEHPPHLPISRLLGGVLFFLTIEAFLSLAWAASNPSLDSVWEAAEAGQGGGYLGAVFGAAVVATGLPRPLAAIIFALMGIGGAALVFGIRAADFRALFNKLGLGRSPATPDTVAPSANGRPARRPVEPAVSPAPAPPAGGPPMPVPNRETRPPRTPANKTPSPATEAAARPEPPPTSELPEAPPIGLGRAAGQTWTLPMMVEILEEGSDQEVNNATIREHVEIIEHTLESFGAPATVVEINQGPTITQFGVEPNFIEQRSGKRMKVKVGKIASLADDLALALAARSIRIQAPVPGKGYVGIEVPNVNKALVSLRDVMEANEFNRLKSPLRLGLGQNVAGQPIAADLTSMPHLLIAGTTGSGKSVCVNSIIACLLLQNTPDDLRVVMIDPKRVELTGYNGIPHLVTPVVVDLERVTGTLQWAMREMDNRYLRFAQTGARNIQEYNKKLIAQGEPKLPFVVLIVDELADLMMMSPEDTERGITRLAQMARATGIHIIIATQRPSVDVVTGLIKANFPARIAFAVASSTDSRVILDTVGAERLLGQGDMLFQSPDAAAPVRMQGCFVSDRELNRLIEYWRTARRAQLATPTPQPPTPDPQPLAPTPQPPTPNPQPPTAPPPVLKQPPLFEEMRPVEEETPKYADELLSEAVELVKKMGKASTSLLQRRFRIGYTRAARLIDVMEQEGLIGPATGTSRAREVVNGTAEDNSSPETPAA